VKPGNASERSGGAGASGDVGRRFRWLPLLPAAWAVLLFHPILTHRFVYDGVAIVGGDSRLDRLSFGLGVWVAQWWEDGAVVPISRPLTQFTYWLQVQLHGRGPLEVGPAAVNPFHAVDLVLFALLCGLVTRLAQRWLSPGASAGLLAGLTGLLFAAHPVHTEVVASTVGRADVLSGLFVIAGLGLWFRWRVKPDGTGGWSWGRAAAIGGCVLAGGLAKEPGYLLAPLLALVEVGLRRWEGRAIFARPIPWRVIGAILVVVIVAAGQRTAMRHNTPDPVEGEVPPAELDNPLGRASAAEQRVTPLKLIGYAARLTAWPLTTASAEAAERRLLDRLRAEGGELGTPDRIASGGGGQLPIRPLNSPDYSPRMLMPTDDLTEPMVLLGLVVTAGWAGLVAWTWRRRHPALSALLAWPVFWFIPSNAVIHIGTIFGERLLLHLSIFVPIALALLLLGPARRRRSVAAAVAAAGLGLVLAFSFASFVYVRAWRSNETLQAYTVTYHPASGRFQGFFAGAIVERALAMEDPPAVMWEQAEYHARLGMWLWPRFDRPYAVLGVVAYERGDRERGLRLLRYARDRGLEWNLADAYLEQVGESVSTEQLEADRQRLRRALDEQPHNRERRLELAATLTRLKRWREAVEQFERADAIAPIREPRMLETYIDATLNRGGESERLRELYGRLVAAKPDQWSVLTDAALVTLATGGDLERAKRWIDRARALSPGSAEPWGALAQWHLARGDREQALAAAREALRRAGPDDPKRAIYLELMRKIRDEADQ